MLFSTHQSQSGPKQWTDLPSLLSLESCRWHGYKHEVIYAEGSDMAAKLIILECDNSNIAPTNGLLIYTALLEVVVHSLYKLSLNLTFLHIIYFQCQCSFPPTKKHSVAFN